MTSSFAGASRSGQFRTAVVGSGLIARKKHLPAWKNLGDEAELAAICDLDLERARKVAGQFGILSIYTDLGELLRQEEPDIIDVCTPPATHEALVRTALESGAHVLVEKPMGIDLDQCDAMIESAEAAGAMLTVAHSDLFYPAFLKARRLIESGELGRFRGMRIFLSTPTDYISSDPEHWAHDLPGGVVGETGPHVVYMSLPFIGRVDDVRVRATKVLDEYPWSPYEDYRIELTGERGTSSIALTYATDYWAAKVELWGSQGLVRADLESQALVRYDRPRLEPTTVGWSAISEGVQTVGSTTLTALGRIARRTRSTHETLIRRMVESLKRGSSPPVSAEEGRETVRVMGFISDRLT